IIYPHVKIGKNCLIYSQVVIREEVEIGDHVIIQPGAVIGADGFGFTRLSDGTPVKIPQKGKVVIGSYCEIGANTCIDRATIEKTVLGDYVKLDNLIQVGHNVRIGKGTAISALTGISGSVEIGENVIMGGQVGIADHAKIADGVMVVAKTGIHGHVKKKGIIAGIPHQDFMTWKKDQAIFKNLEKYVDRIKQLEKKIKEMEEKAK
ncbi:MAG: UDP-3-O-(3-hydroxymyristoyl)glucosamine N-acyltransferase, partial [Candidatus Aminicenantes bacterium]